MKWNQFYNKPLSLGTYIDNISDHKPFLTEIINSQDKNEKILEVGSGSGAISIFFSQLGYMVVSIDNNEGVLAIARHNNANFGGRVTFKKQMPSICHLRMTALMFASHKVFSSISLMIILENCLGNSYGFPGRFSLASLHFGTPGKILEMKN